MAGRWVDVAEAARELEISTDPVGKREWLTSYIERRKRGSL
jgi:hypothetical protein